MTVDELAKEVKIYLKTLRAPDVEHLTLGYGTAHQFIIEKFGIIVCIVEMGDVSFIATKIHDFFKDFRIVYATPSDDLVEKLDDIFFNFVRGGYIRWLRDEDNRHFRNIVINQRVGDKILKKRVEIYGDKPMYKFWAEEDAEALKAPLNYIYSMEPGFFDYLPTPDE